MPLMLVRDGWEINCKEYGQLSVEHPVKRPKMELRDTALKFNKEKP